MRERTRAAVVPLLVSGALLGLAFLPLPLGFLAWFALVPLLATLDRRIGRGDSLRRCSLVGYGFGSRST
jgi:apolipoprotein N-acyltransferase